MKKDNMSESDRILQIHRIEEMDHLFDGPWVTLYQSERDLTGLKSRYCVLLRKNAVADELKYYHRTIEHDSGRPSYFTRGDDVEYARYGGLEREGMEPLIFALRSPDGKEERVEIAEEFRHFHQLWHDREKNYLIGVNNEYEEEVVAKITDSSVCVRRRHLAEFMAAKQMCLVLYFACDEEFEGEEIPADLEKQYFAADRAWSRYYADLESPTSILVGKIIFFPKPVPSSDSLFEDEGQYEDFIIGEDGDGRKIMHTCNPAMLNKPGGQPFLTLVYFSRHALEEYYNNVEVYTVEDGSLHKDGGLGWCMPIDNNHPDYIDVFLGDLAKMPHKEQIRWRAHNIVSEGGMSRVGHYRAILGEFTDPEAPDLIFKWKLKEFQNDWKKKFGWDLFRPLQGDNLYVLKQLHIPADDSVSNFGTQILNLAKLLVDSLNAEKLDIETKNSYKENASIGKLEGYLEHKQYRYVHKNVKILLRDLQALRSSGSAHLIGERYDKLLEKRNMTEVSRRKIFIMILNGANGMLDGLRKHFLEEKEKIENIAAT